MWFVGCVYQDSIKPFYTTDNFVLARNMFLRLLDLGYKHVATNAHWQAVHDQWIRVTP